MVGAVAIGRRGTSPQAALIITLGLSVLAYALAILLWGDQPRSAPGIAGNTHLFGARVQTHYFLVIGVTLTVFAALGALFTRTDTGRALSACASNSYAARVVGIDVRRMGLLAFTAGGALGGLAGALLIPLQPMSFDSDLVLVVNGFAAAVLGALTRLLPTLLGGLLLGVAQALVAGYGNAAYQTEVALALMLALMIWRAGRYRSVVEETV